MGRAWTDAEIETMKSDAARVLREGAKVPAVCVSCRGTLVIDPAINIYPNKTTAKVSCPECQDSFHI